MARSRATMPYTTRATPIAAAIATRMITVPMATRPTGRSLRLRERPSGVHLVRSDAAHGGEVGAGRIRLVGRGLIVLERLERVLEDSVGEEPEHVLRVACGHQHREAARDLRRAARGGGGSDSDDVEVSKDRPHDRRPGI